MILSRRQLVGGGILLACLALLAWAANPWRLWFANDDFYHIPLSAGRHLAQSNLLRPVSELSLWLDSLVWEKNAAGFHLTNLLLHIMNGGLLYLFVNEWTRPFSFPPGFSKKWLAASAALLLLVYPGGMEALFWILGRGASLACLFNLLTLLFFLKGRQRPAAYGISLIFFAFSLLTYETGFIIPLLLLVLAAGPGAKEQKKVPRWVLPAFFLLLLALLALRFSLTGILLGDHEAGPLLQGNWGRLVYNANALLARSLLPPLVNGALMLSLYIILLLLLLLDFFHLKKTASPFYPFIRQGAVLFLISLLPVVAPGLDTHTTEGSRFLYFPAVFLIPVLLASLYSWAGRGRVLVMMLGLYFALSFLVLSGPYRAGARVARGTLEGLQGDGRHRVVYALDLPTQYRGALVFRKSFVPALHWICSGLSYDTVQVLQARTLQQEAPDPYRVEPLPFTQWRLAYPQWINAAGDSLRASPSGPGRFAFDPARDLLLQWTDSVLYKITP